MKLNDVLSKLYAYIRTTDTITWPFIFEKNGNINIAFVSYFESDKQPFIIDGIDRFVSYCNDNIDIQHCKMFKKRNWIIIDESKELVSKEKHEQLKSAYYSTLETLINNFHSENRQQYIDEFKKAFCDVVPVEYYELYRRACPEFMQMLNL